MSAVAIPEGVPAEHDHHERNHPKRYRKGKQTNDTVWHGDPPVITDETLLAHTLGRRTQDHGLGPAYFEPTFINHAYSTSNQSSFGVHPYFPRHRRKNFRLLREDTDTNQILCGSETSFLESPLFPLVAPCEGVLPQLWPQGR